MGRLPSFVMVIIGVVLIGGVGAGGFFYLVKPQQEALTRARASLTAEEAVAAELNTVKDELVKVTRRANEYWRDFERAQDTRSIPISFAQPITAWITLWPEYRQTLPRLIEEFVESSGCTILSGVAFPPPPAAPPAAPASGFLEIPQGGISLTVEGDLSSIERLYKSLSTCSRVALISSLSLTSDGSTITAQVPFSFYLLAEVPERAAPEAQVAAGPAGGIALPQFGAGAGPEDTTEAEAGPSETGGLRARRETARALEEEPEPGI